MPTPLKHPRSADRPRLLLWQATAILMAAAWVAPAQFGRWIAAGCLALCGIALLGSYLPRRAAPTADIARGQQSREHPAPRTAPAAAAPAQEATARARTAPAAAPVKAAARTWEAHTGNEKVFHVIATRHGIGVFDENWFEFRQHLLENITVPSLDAQTEKDFVWLIAIDRDMPERARKRIDELAETRPYVRLLELELKSDFRDSVARWASKKAEKRNADWVMTTRLDDDDALNVGMVERLRREAKAYVARRELRPALFAPVIGCNWVPIEMSGHRTFRPGPSMGLSMLVPAEERRTAYHGNHMKINRQMAAAGAYVKCIDDDTLWWLYAHTSVSDQQHEGSDRRTVAHSHAEAFAIDAGFLRQFGISAESAELLRSVPEPEPVDTTYYLTSRGEDVEKRIIELRTALRKEQFADADEAAALENRITELHAVRSSMHEHIIKPKPEQISSTDGRPAVS